MSKKVLLFGATGATGKHALEKAVSLGDHKIVVFCRNESKIPESLRSKIEIVKGDCTNSEEVKACVASLKPDSIIFTTCVGFTNELVSLNQILVPAVVEALTEGGRLDSCKIIYLSGAGSPNPPSRSYDSFFTFIMWMVGLKGAVYDNTAAQEYLASTDPSLSFTVVKMGMVQEGATKGTIVGKRCCDDQPWGLWQIAFSDGVRFCDVGAFLVALATVTDTKDVTFNRQFFLMEYSKST